MKLKAGFTLAEILVVIAVISVVGIIITDIFIRSVRGGNKAQISSALKQNGQLTLDEMDKTIRGADAVVCQTSDTIVVSSSQLSYASPLASPTNSRYTRFRFINPTATINGKVQEDNPASYSDTMCSDVQISPITISDSNSKIGASITGGSFTRNKQAGYKDVITIQFNVLPGVDAPQIVASSIDPIPFNTSIVLR